MQRMSGLDASFLYLETPAMPMNVGLLVIIDTTRSAAPYDYTEVFRRIETAAHRQPVLAQQVMEVPFSVDHPRWVHTTELDVLHHVRRVTCPGAGSQADLCSVVDRVLAMPLDRGRPLWEVWVIEGLADGRYALLAKVHHALTDGVNGMQIMASLFSGDAARVAQPENDVAPALEVTPDPLTLLREGLRARSGVGREVWRLAARTRNAVEGVFAQRKQSQQRGGTLLRAPRAPWNQPITRERVTALAEVRADDIRDVRKLLGVSANDVLLSLCASALRRYLLRRGELPREPLTAACPVVARTANDARNRISALVLSMATDIEDPVERVRAVAASGAMAREEHSSLGSDMMASWAELAAPALVRGAMRIYADLGISALHPPLYNLSISNVPGPRRPLTFAGGDVVATYPLGPVVDGVGLNITMLSYAGVYGIGFVAAKVAFPDLEKLASGLSIAVEELKAATSGLRQRSASAEKR
jgi:WS/DGAT/MGAT family acyltransferase